MNWLDYTFAIILALSTFFSLRKGLVRELLGLIGTVLGLILAFWFYGVAGSLVEPYLSSRRLANIAGFIMVFGAVLIAGSLLGWITNKFLKATGLSIIDRLLGAVFGLLRGAAVCLAILTAVIAWSPREDRAAAPSAVVNSRIAPVLSEASRIAVAMAPMDLRKSFDEGYSLLRKAWQDLAGKGNA